MKNAEDWIKECIVNHILWEHIFIYSRLTTEKYAADIEIFITLHKNDTLYVVY